MLLWLYVYDYMTQGLSTGDQGTVRVFKALGSGVRLRIARVLASNGEVSCRQLRDLFTFSQPTMSRHFTKLVETGLIRVRKAGPSHFYSLNRPLLRRHGITLRP